MPRIDKIVILMIVQQLNSTDCQKAENSLKRQSCLKHSAFVLIL